MTTEDMMIDAIFKNFSSLKTGDIIETPYNYYGIKIIILEVGYSLVSDCGTVKYFPFVPRNYEIEKFKESLKEGMSLLVVE